MSVLKMLGVPVPDKDGTFKIAVEEVGDCVHMRAGGHTFAKVVVKDGHTILLQVIDIDTGVRAEYNVQTLCWRR